MCMGMKFAVSQVKAALAHLVFENEVILESPKTAIEIAPGGLLFQSKEDLKIKFKAFRDE